MGGRGSDQVPPLAAYPPTDRARQPAQSPRLPPDVHDQIAAGRLDQRGQGWQCGLAVPGLIGADHALRDARPGGQLRLRKPRVGASPPQQRPGRVRCLFHERDYS